MEIKNLDKVKKKFESQNKENKNLSDERFRKNKERLVNFWKSQKYPLYFKVEYRDFSGSYYKIDEVIITESILSGIHFKGEKISNNLDIINFDIYDDYIISSPNTISIISESEYNSFKLRFIEKIKKLNILKNLPTTLDLEKYSVESQRYIIHNLDEFKKINSQFFNKCFILFRELDVDEDEDEIDLKDRVIKSYIFIRDVSIDWYSPHIRINLDEFGVVESIDVNNTYGINYKNYQKISYNYFNNILNVNLNSMIESIKKL